MRFVAKYKNMRRILKIFFAYVSVVIIFPISIFKPLFLLTYYFFRACYTQYKRLELKKSDVSLVITYPIELRGGQYIQCGKNVFMGANGILSAWDLYRGVKYFPQIIIGNNVTIGNGFHISAINKILIGNDVLMGKFVTIVDNLHGKIEYSEMNIPPIQRELQLSGEVIIGDRVWIGDKVTIARGVTIGNGAIVGSNSVVTKDIPSNAVAVGAPAKVIKLLVNQ